MKTKHKIEKEDLIPSTSLNDAGYLVFPHKRDDGTIEECPVYGLVSDECATEQEALDSLNRKVTPLLEKLPGNDYYSMYDEIKVWHGVSKLPDIPDRFAAYERLVLPGLDATTIRSILNVPLI